MDEHGKHTARHVVTVGALAAAVGVSPVLANSPPDIETTYEMKDAPKLLVHCDGKMATECGRSSDMHEGMMSRCKPRMAHA